VATIIGRKSHHRNGPMIATPDYKNTFVCGNSEFVFLSGNLLS
jgi:hypothetical protein